MSMATLLPKPGAFSKGYNFAYAWDKNAPLTDQQHAAISALSHALSWRPFPPNLEEDKLMITPLLICLLIISPLHTVWHCLGQDTKGAYDQSQPTRGGYHQISRQEDGGTEKESALEEEAAAMDAVLVNTHQFYKWFAQLESAMKSETNEKYCLYESTLQEHVNTCDAILRQVDDTLNLFEEVQILALECCHKDTNFA